MKLKKQPKSKGGNWVLQYTEKELQHKSFYLDNMIFKRQENLVKGHLKMLVFGH